MKIKYTVMLLLALWFLSLPFILPSQLPSKPSIDTISLQYKTTMLEKQVEELKRHYQDEVAPVPPIPIRYIPVWLSTMTFLLTIFLGIATYQSFIKVKEAKEQILETQKLITKAENLIEKADTKIERTDLKIEKAETFINAIKEKSERLNAEIKKNIEDFLQLSQNRVVEIEKMKDEYVSQLNQLSSESKESLKTVEQIKMKLSSTQSYLYQSVEKLFSINQSIADLSNDKKLLELQYLYRGISQIYSPFVEDRISGINILGAKGRMSDIEHLDHLILSNDEQPEIKLKATIAKADILSRG
jgi:DNA repair exonuclease SbcCD ATPase subunit